MIEAELSIPYDQQGKVADVYEHARVVTETFDETGRKLTVRALPRPSRADEGVRRRLMIICMVQHRAVVAGDPHLAASVGERARKHGVQRLARGRVDALERAAGRVPDRALLAHGPHVAGPRPCTSVTAGSPGCSSGTRPPASRSKRSTKPWAWLSEPPTTDGCRAIRPDRLERVRR